MKTSFVKAHAGDRSNPFITVVDASGIDLWTFKSYHELLIVEIRYEELSYFGFKDYHVFDSLHDTKKSAMAAETHTVYLARHFLNFARNSFQYCREDGLWIDQSFIKI